MSYCPTPDKKQYSKKDARSFVNAHPERQLRSYKCSGGHWHLTHKPIGIGGPVTEIRLKLQKQFENLLASNSDQCPG